MSFVSSLARAKVMEIFLCSRMGRKGIPNFRTKTARDADEEDDDDEDNKTDIYPVPGIQ